MLIFFFPKYAPFFTSVLSTTISNVIWTASSTPSAYDLQS